MPQDVNSHIGYKLLALPIHWRLSLLPHRSATVSTAKMGSWSRLSLLALFVAVTLGHLRIHTISQNGSVTTIAEEDAQAVQSNPILPRWEPQNLATARVFEDARCKGEKFLAAMKASDAEASKILAPQANLPSMRSVWQGGLKCKHPISYPWSTIH